MNDTSDHSYRLGFVFAITLHVVLALFLLIRFNSSRSVALNSANNFINAVVINERDITSKPIDKPEQKNKPELKKEEIITKIKIKQPDNNLLAEQAKKEVAELKKTIAKKQKQRQEQQQEKILHEQIMAERKQLANEKAGAQSQGEVDKYKAAVIQVISSQWIVPDGVIDGKATGQLLINIAPSGDVLSVQVSSSSGNVALDHSACAAVHKASPLPVPEDPRLFDATMKVKFTPQGII